MTFDINMPKTQPSEACREALLATVTRTRSCSGRAPSELELFHRYKTYFHTKFLNNCSPKRAYNSTCNNGVATNMAVSAAFCPWKELFDVRSVMSDTLC